MGAALIIIIIFWIDFSSNNYRIDGVQIKNSSAFPFMIFFASEGQTKQRPPIRQSWDAAAQYIYVLAPSRKLF